MTGWCGRKAWSLTRSRGAGDDSPPPRMRLRGSVLRRDRELGCNNGPGCISSERLRAKNKAEGREQQTGTAEDRDGAGKHCTSLVPPICSRRLCISTLSSATAEMRKASGRDASWTGQDSREHSSRSMKTPKTGDRAALGLGLRLRRTRKTAPSVASRAAAGGSDRPGLPVCSSGRIVGLGRAAAAW